MFFQEALAELPQLVGELAAGGPRRRHPLRRRTLADRDGAALPGLELVGIEFEPDSVARARSNVAPPGWATGSRSSRATWPSLATEGRSTWPTSSTPCTSWPIRSAALRTAWAALKAGGRILVLDWALPSTLEEFRTRQGELIAGVQLDELYQGTALATREQFAGWFADGWTAGPMRSTCRRARSLFVGGAPPSTAGEERAG